MSTYRRAGLPLLDCHAHISPSVTRHELDDLHGAVIFAVTRSLEEAEAVRRRSDRNLIWGCGIHPGKRETVERFEPERFEALLTDFLLVGELGLDRKAGNVTEQARVLREAMRLLARQGVLCSIHSAGCAELVLDVIDEYRPQGCILHWFNAADDLVARAVNLGCYFSVNVAMTDAAISRIPSDRLLPETDFPATRRCGVYLPGDIGGLEERVSMLGRLSRDEVRIRWYRNLKRLVMKVGLFARIPDDLADLLISV